MADDMCGPSNGAKNLLSHADRDRSLHQDRFVGAPNGAGQSFRSQQPTTNGDAAFQSFLAAPVGPELGSATPGMVDHFNHMTLAERSGSPMGLAQARAANANMSVEQYNRFLQGMGGQRGIANSSIAAPFAHNGGNLVNPQAVMAAPVARNTNMLAQPTYLPANGSMMGQGFPITHPMSPLSMMQHNPITAGNVFAQPAAATGHVIQADTIGMTADAFNAAFDEIEKDGEFQREVDEWMAEHGQAADQVRTAEPTAEEWQDINAEMTRIADAADALEAADRQDSQDAQDTAAADQANINSEEELARAAADILASTSGDTSTKFKESKFLDLMRRIASQEVTVVGDSLVDIATGTEIATKAADYDGHEGSDAQNAAGGQTKNVQP